LFPKLLNKEQCKWVINMYQYCIVLSLEMYSVNGVLIWAWPVI